MSDGTTTESLGALVRRLRRARGLTLEGLAAASGLSERALGDLERGASEHPQRRTLVALSAALRLDRDEQTAVRAAVSSAPPREADGVAVEPVPAIDFRGRGAELDVVRRLLAASGGRRAPLVIAGPPGIGKTTLMIEAAARFAGGAPRAFVDLRGLDAVPVPPLAVLRSVLQQIDPERDPPRSLGAAEAEWRTVAEAKRPVVLLDNASAEDQVRPVLRSGADAAIVVTSRSRLPGLEGVRRRPLSPLSRADSVALLLAIAPDADGAEALDRVAALCDDMPLALRVAGNRLASRPEWTVDDLEAGLSSEERRLSALTAGDLAIESAFDLSYRHMDQQARRLFRRLAILPATSFSAEIAAQLLAPGGAVPEAEIGMDALVDLGMVQPVAGRRYRLHDLVRLFAASRLRDEEPLEERTAAAGRLEGWLLDVAAAAGSHFEPATTPPAVRDVVLADRAAADRWLRQESEHWFRALASAASGGRHAQVVDVALRLHWFSDRWLRWGRWLELFSLAASSAAHVGVAERAELLGHVAWAQIVEREAFAEAVDTARLAEALAAEAGAVLPLAWATYYRAWAETRLGRIDGAVDASQRAFAAFDAAGDVEGAAQALMLAVFAVRQGRRDQQVQARVDAVLEYLDRESLDDYVATCTRSNAAMYSAQAAHALGRDEEALRWAERSIAHADPIGYLRTAAEAAAVHAAAQLALGRRETAVLELADVVDRFEATGERERAAESRALREHLLAER